MQSHKGLQTLFYPLRMWCHNQHRILWALLVQLCLHTSCLMIAFRSFKFSLNSASSISRNLRSANVSKALKTMSLR